MRPATGHKRMQPTNPLLWRHQATGDPSKDLQQGVPAAKRFCLWFQVSWIFFCFVLFDWFFNWCLHFFKMMCLPLGWVFIQGKWTSPEVECINWNPGRMRHFLGGAMLHIRVFFFRVFVFKPMVLREGADPIHVVRPWSQDLKFRVGNSCPTIK